MEQRRGKSPGRISSRSEHRSRGRVRTLPRRESIYDDVSFEEIEFKRPELIREANKGTQQPVHKADIFIPGMNLSDTANVKLCQGSSTFDTLSDMSNISIHNSSEDIRNIYFTDAKSPFNFFVYENEVGEGAFGKIYSFKTVINEKYLIVKETSDKNEIKTIKYIQDNILSSQKTSVCGLLSAKYFEVPVVNYRYILFEDPNGTYNNFSQSYNFSYEFQTALYTFILYQHISNDYKALEIISITSGISNKTKLLNDIFDKIKEIGWFDDFLDDQIKTYIAEHRTTKYYIVLPRLNGDLHTIDEIIFKLPIEDKLEILRYITSQLLCLTHYNCYYTDIKLTNFLYSCVNGGQFNIMLGDLGSIFRSDQNYGLATFPPLGTKDAQKIPLEDQSIIWGLKVMLFSMFSENPDDIIFYFVHNSVVKNCNNKDYPRIIDELMRSYIPKPIYHKLCMPKFNSLGEFYNEILQLQDQQRAHLQTVNMFFN